MFGFLRKKPEEREIKSYSYTLPIIEDGRFTGCFMCRSDDKPPEMGIDEFLELVEKRWG